MKKELVEPFRIGLVIFIIVFINLISNAQYETFPVKELSKEFPEEDVIIYSSDVVYTVDLNKNGVPVKIIEEAVDKYVSLKNDVYAFDNRFYDHYSEITKHRVSGTGIFAPRTSQLCGDYEIDGIFYHDAKVCNFYLQFEDPGEYLTVKTTKEINDIKYFTRIELHKLYATKSRKITLKIPLSVNVELIEMNFNFNIQKTENIDHKANIKEIEYIASNIPSRLQLENSPGYSCAFPHLLVLVKSFEKSGEKIGLMENNDDLYSWYKTLVTETDLSHELIEITNNLTQSCKSDTTKMASVYYWIQDKIRYIAFENGYAAFVPEKPENVYKLKYGDCKGMANLLKTMLKHLGYDARLCWVYTGTCCYSRHTPSIAADNHMICAVKIDENFLFLDPTVEYTTIYETNEGIQGKEVMIEDGDNYIVHQIPYSPHTLNKLKVENSISLNDNKLLVNGNISLSGARKKSFQYFYNYLDSKYKEDLLNYFVTHTDNNFYINEIKTTPPDSMTEQFDLVYSMEVSNNVLDLGSEILLTLDFYNEFRDAKIDSTRKFDYAFNYRVFTQHDIQFQIPEGMTVLSLPDSMKIVHPKYIFEGGYAIEDNQLLYQKNISLLNNVITTAEIAEWNKSVEQLIKFYNEMVVLQKQ